MGVTVDCDRATEVCDIRMPKADEFYRADYKISANLGSISIPYHQGSIRILGNGLQAIVDLKHLKDSRGNGLRRALWDAIDKFKINAYVSGYGQVAIGNLGTMSGGTTLDNVSIGKWQLFKLIDPLLVLRLRN